MMNWVNGPVPGLWFRGANGVREGLREGLMGSGIANCDMVWYDMEYGV